jgi:dTDP-4-dehydrorhamnose 3,5-epimerase
MLRVETSLPGVLEWRRVIHGDERGFFIETYHQARFTSLGISDTFVQDNHSRSAKGTLRGLHYQLKQPQAKLCRVIEGEALDVAVDIRLGSPHFGRWTSILLSGTQHNQIYVPQGFAHGFLALTDNVQFLYKCSDYYAPEDEHGILWDDPALNITWGIANLPFLQKMQETVDSLKSPRNSCRGISQHEAYYSTDGENGPGWLRT